MKVFRFVCWDALLSVTSRPGKLSLTAFGATLGIASLVAVIGLTTTAAAQIVGRFDSSASTYVSVQPVETQPDPDATTLTWAAVDNVRWLRGVEDVAATGTLPASLAVAGMRLSDPAAVERAAVPVLAASPEIGATLELEFSRGRMFDSGHDARAEPVAVIGAEAASRLGIDDSDRQQLLTVGGVDFRILGTFDEAMVGREMLGAVLVPPGVAAREFGLGQPRTVHIRTEAGAASAIAEQATLALNPGDPTRLAAAYTPDARVLRAQVSQDTQALLVVVGLVSMLAGTVGIMNIMLLAVVERTPEIGLRRAVGARRLHVMGQFIAEASLIGFLGGLVGSALGALAIVGLSTVRGWTPVADWWLFPLGVLLGGVSGMVAGVVPAWRAASVEPAASLRAV